MESRKSEPDVRVTAALVCESVEPRCYWRRSPFAGSAMCVSKRVRRPFACDDGGGVSSFERHPPHS
jgi:hypothetical protein